MLSKASIYRAVGSTVSPILISCMVLSSFVVAYAQNNPATNGSGDGEADIIDLQDQLHQAPQLGWNEIDKQDWEDLLANQTNTSKYDKRIITQLLPALVGQENNLLDGLVVSRLRRGYTNGETSYETAGATNASQHGQAKAVALAALGTTWCGTDVIFPRRLDQEKPLWVHQQTQVDTKEQERWPFSRNFDSLARQFFWIEARAFTNRPITATTWSSFLQQVAKGEIEERFGLTPGSLANSSASDLDQTVARARLAKTLGLPDLPEANSESEFFEALGRRRLEIELNLPRNSFVGGDSGQSWREIYQQIGFRVLEQQVSLPEDFTNKPLFQDVQFLVSDPRFLQLQKRLEVRSQHYTDPRIAFNLPTEEYLTTNSGQNIFQRVVSGDPEAFSIIGAYFLADSLELSPNDTKQFILKVSQQAGELPAIPLANARPIDPNLSSDEIFNSDTEKHPVLFELLGRGLSDQIRDQLPKLNDSVLRALSDNNNTPNYEDVLAVITNIKQQQDAIQKLAITSAEDANYFQINPDGSFKKDGGKLTPGFTTNNLRNRGIAILSKTLGIDVVSLAQLETTTSDTELITETNTVAEQIDEAIGWPSGTTDQLTRRSPESGIEEALLTDKQLIEIGADNLWDRLGVSDELKTVLTTYFFTDSIPENAPIPTDEDEAVTEESESVDSDNLDEESDEEIEISESSESLEELGEDEFLYQSVLQSHPAALDDSLSLGLGISLNDLELLITGRMMPALIHITLARLGKEITPKDSTVILDDATLLDLFTDPATDEAAQLTNIATDFPFIQESYLNKIAGAIQDDDLYQIWRTTHSEAVYQWNVFCPNKQQEAKAAIAKVIDYLVSLPSAEGNSVATPPTRPYQILTYDLSVIDSDTALKINEAYPDADGQDIKSGAFNNPRDWDHLYIGY